MGPMSGIALIGLFGEVVLLLVDFILPDRNRMEPLRPVSELDNEEGIGCSSDRRELTSEQARTLAIKV